MFVMVVATLCLIADAGNCIEKVVTDQGTLMQCKGPFAAQAIPGWMEAEGYSARGYRLTKWDCVAPDRRRVGP